MGVRYCGCNVCTGILTSVVYGGILLLIGLVVHFREFHVWWSVLSLIYYVYVNVALCLVSRQKYGVRQEVSSSCSCTEIY